MVHIELPEPIIPYLQQLKGSKSSDHTGSTAGVDHATDSSSGKDAGAASSTSKPRALRRESLDIPGVDPWASPATQKSRTKAVSNDATPKSNGITAARPISSVPAVSSRTTSAFTTQSDGPASSPGEEPPSGEAPVSGSVGGWGSYDASPAGGFGNIGQSSLGAEGFVASSGGPGEDPSSSALGRAIGGGRVTGRGIEEVITITVLPEKEGMFMFQHRNYEVKSSRRNSTVVRRYSDFVWLLDCLHKRYPFRQLPLLPPKRVAGTYILH